MGKFLHLLKTNKNIPIYAAAVMLCLTLLSSYVVSGVYASYATNSRTNENARVAKFSVEGDGVLLRPIEAKLSPGESLKETLNIHNNSEVTVEYTLTVSSATNNLPLHFKVTKTGASLEQEGNDITITNQQLPGSHVDQYELDIEWGAGDNDPAVMGMVDYIAVTVTAVQID